MKVNSVIKRREDDNLINLMIIENAVGETFHLVMDDKQTKDFADFVEQSRIDFRVGLTFM